MKSRLSEASVRSSGFGYEIEALRANLKMPPLNFPRANVMSYARTVRRRSRI
jgi:hypothetical protein